jgi:hypothetical protein
MAKVVPLYSPRETYMRHIARANHIILNRVINEIQNQNNNEQQ